MESKEAFVFNLTVLSSEGTGCGSVGPGPVYKIGVYQQVLRVDELKRWCDLKIRNKSVMIEDPLSPSRNSAGRVTEACVSSLVCWKG